MTRPGGVSPSSACGGGPAVVFATLVSANFSSPLTRLTVELPSPRLALRRYVVHVTVPAAPGWTRNRVVTLMSRREAGVPVALAMTTFCPSTSFFVQPLVLAQRTSLSISVVLDALFTRSVE